MGTPKSEIDAVTPYLNDHAQIENLVLYSNFMKEYYELERTIQNLSC